MVVQSWEVEGMAGGAEFIVRTVMEQRTDLAAWAADFWG